MNKTNNEFKVSLKNDYIFKKIFAKEENNSKLKDFLEAILNIEIKKEEYVDMGYEEERIMYEEREKAIINYNFGMASAERQGKEEGLKEGLKEGKREGKREGEEKKKIEIIENMLKLKIDDEIIKKSVNISDEELEKYKKKIRV